MNSKTSNIYPWVIVGLLWGVALLNYMDGGLFVGIWVDESHFRDYR